MRAPGPAVTMRGMGRLRTAAYALAVAALALPALACQVTGPRAIKTGRDNYNVAIAQTNDQQLLLNLVRLRYRDTPLFLEVSSITSSVVFELGSSASGTVFPTASRGAGLGGNVGYTDKPTISYSPLQGARFVTQLLSPLDPKVLLLMYHSGWSIDRIMKICVQRLGPLDNASRASGPTPSSPPEHEPFFEATALLRQLWLAGALEMGSFTDDRGESLVLRIAENWVHSPASRRLAELLGLPEPQQTLVFADGDPSGVTLVPRSLMAALFYLSQSVEVPKRDLEAGRVTETRDADGESFDWTAITGGLMRIRNQRSQPGDAYVAVPYRGRWFYIDDSDLDSKSTFSLVSQLFELQSGNIKHAGPTLTIPVSN